MNATQSIAVIGGLTQAQAHEFLSNAGRPATLRIVRHLSIAAPTRFRGDETFDEWRHIDLAKAAVEVLFSRAA